MDKAKFDDLVILVEQQLEVPSGVIFIEGYDDWQARLRLARLLSTHLQKYDEAIELFESAVDEKPVTVEQFEDIVWALKDLFVCTYYHEKKILKALTYLDKAIKLSELDLTKQFTFFTRGELWCWRWFALKEIDMTEQALAEAEEKIAAFDLNNKAANSYLYYAYYFIAALAYEDEAYGEAWDILREALRYFPKDEQSAEFMNIDFSTKLAAREKYDKALLLTKEGGNWLL